MVIVNVYKIYNFVDETDKEIYIGSTKQQKLYYRWGNHKAACKGGLDRKLYNHMRNKGAENFKCVVIHSEEINENNSQKKIEQRFVDELKPSLNINHVDGFKNIPYDEKRVNKTIDELRKYNSEYEAKAIQYAKKYHETYSPEYYKLNKDTIRGAQKQYYSINKNKLAQEKNLINAETKKSKKYYCQCCDLALTSPSALEMHNISKRHVQKIEKL